MHLCTCSWSPTLTLAMFLTMVKGRTGDVLRTWIYDWTSSRRVTLRSKSCCVSHFMTSKNLFDI